MVRILTFALLLAVPVAVSAQGSEAADDFVVGVDVSLVGVSGYDAWTDGAPGKLRYSDSGLKLARLFFDYDGRVADTIDASVAVEVYGDGLGTAIDLTETYLEWRPVPRSPNIYRVKVGAFYPRISLENTARGWSNPYLQNSSAINTWVAEELRSFGLEFSWSRKPASLGGLHRLSVDAAVFKGNDPAGTYMTWKGWSIHDRQSRFSDKLPLPPLPEVGPGGAFARQEPYTEPFREIDDAAGYYVNAEWQYASRLLLRAMFYDNRTDPASIISGQYGWHTEFAHVGLQLALPGEVGLISQWMSGSTVMGPNLGGGVYPADVGYDSYFLLLTRAWGRHRVAARYDSFSTTDNDPVAGDDNAESGLGWNLGYRYALNEFATLGLDYLSIRTRRLAFTYNGLEPTVTEKQSQLTLQLRF